jgi:uncharacterized protein YdeI (YjbR/CyaY-like superfamily)
LDSANEALDGLEITIFEDAARWEAWLGEHHEDEAGVWLKVAKKDSGLASVTIAEALEVALCYGWIDSHRKAYDERFYLQKYTPRRSRSSWSKVNVDKVEALIAAGRMQVSGFAQIAAARADGSGMRRTSRSGPRPSREICRRPSTRTPWQRSDSSPWARVIAMR